MTRAVRNVVLHDRELAGKAVFVAQPLEYTLARVTLLNQAIRDVSVGEILEGALGIEPAKWTKLDQMRVGAWLKSRHWERYQCRTGNTREWRYRKLPAETG